MTRRYYSERTQGPKPRLREELTPEFWGGLVALIRAGLGSGLFAESFPERCPEGSAVIGCDVQAFALDLTGDFPGLEWPLELDMPVSTADALDLVEYLCANASVPQQGMHHSFYDHYHLLFSAKRPDLVRDRVNRLFAANEMAYEVTNEGLVQHLGSPVVPHVIGQVLPPSRARKRRRALEPLWDAFERIKTLLDTDKKKGTEKLIAAVTSDPSEKGLIEAEMSQLSAIGNGFQIRHHEVGKAPVSDPLAEYLFVRMYTLLYRLHPGIR